MGKMLTKRARLALGAAALAAALVPVATANATPTAPGNSTAGTSRAPVCDAVPVGVMRCNSIATTNRVGAPSFDPATSSYFDATELQSAYGQHASTASVGSGPTVAIVDAYYTPNVFDHLLQYRTAMGQPICDDSTVNCILSEKHYASTTNTGWGQETDLDVQMVSAICPECRILLVSAASANYSDIFTAVNYAKTQAGVVAVSNSYGSNEFSGETSGSYASTYTSSSVVFTVSSGDNGYGAEYPSSLATVVSVGGTSLSGNSTDGWTETAWSGAGSGCSAYVVRPTWQTSLGTCSKRRTADISAVANPSTGVLVYTTGSSTGWYAFGGTSVASPIIAATYAHNTGGTTHDASQIYLTSGSGLTDVRTGSNGRCVTKRTNSANAPLCTAGPGWDGPTGWGTPRAGTIPR